MKLGGKIWIGKIGRHMDSARCGKDADCFPIAFGVLEEIPATALENLGNITKSSGY